MSCNLACPVVYLMSLDLTQGEVCQQSFQYPKQPISPGKDTQTYQEHSLIYATPECSEHPVYGGGASSLLPVEELEESLGERPGPLVGSVGSGGIEEILKEALQVPLLRLEGVV